MGCDIHGVFQRLNRETNKWEDIPHNYTMGRHYQLFAVLAGVRNGTGFAGVNTGEAVKPIAEQRGYPEGFFIDTLDGEREDFHPITTLDHMDPRRRKWHGDDEDLGVWMGDHSHSWLTGKEMLSWFKAAPIVVKTGIFSRPLYEQWDKKSPPNFPYCGGISGPGVVVINDNGIERDSTPNWTHIRCEWKTDLKAELDYFFEEVSSLSAEHGEVRFVFGFDS